MPLRQAGGVLSLYSLGAIGGVHVGEWFRNLIIGSMPAQLVSTCLTPEVLYS